MHADGENRDEPDEGVDEKGGDDEDHSEDHDMDSNEEWGDNEIVFCEARTACVWICCSGGVPRSWQRGGSLGGTPLQIVHSLPSLTSVMIHWV